MIMFLNPISVYTPISCPAGKNLSYADRKPRAVVQKAVETCSVGVTRKRYKLFQMGYWNGKWRRRERLVAKAAATDTMDLGGVGSRWRKLCGEDKWSGLLDPLDLDLRRYIIQYGEMCQATYDCFNSSRWSKHAGNSMFSKDNFFSKVSLNRSNYEVVKFFYATSSVDLPTAFLVRSSSTEPWSKRSNWIGYIAVATDEGAAVLGRRDIVIALRGTIDSLEWVEDFKMNLISAAALLGNYTLTKPMVHNGFKSMYTGFHSQSRYNKKSARDQIWEELQRLMELHKEEDVSITVTGHSLGAALATLCAADIVANKVNKPKSMPEKPCPVTAVVFACPRVGDSGFKNHCSKQTELHVLRVRNKLDMIAMTPPVGFADVGVELLVDSSKSSYLKSSTNMGSWHNLEVHLHMIAGTQGPKSNKFKLEIPRSVALINKYMDGLKDEYLVPPNWWTLKHKGMKQLDDGSWELVDYDEDYIV